MINLKSIALSIAFIGSLSLASATDFIHPQKIVDGYKKTIFSIDTKGLVKLLKTEPNTRIIDIRDKTDIIKQGGFIKANRVSIVQRDKLEFLLPQILDDNKEKFIIHCYHGNSSALAAKQLKDMGFENVIWYKDNFPGWQKAGLEIRNLDEYPESILFSKVKKVAENIYTSIGAMGPHTYENVGHNNNLAFIIGEKDVLVWNASSNYLLAKAFHEEIKRITDKPVKYVVLENSQGHAANGTGYWKEQGAAIVAHEISKKELKRDTSKMIERAQKRYRDKALGTYIVLPDITFKDNYKIDLGNDLIIEVKYFGKAHEHDDIALWLPNQKVLFAGDIAFYQRILPIFKITDTANWLKVWEEVEALKAKIVVPGHGDVTDMEHVRAHTKDYLVYMRDEITKVMDDGGEMGDAYNIDQSKFEHLDAFELLGKRNAATLFSLMEFEE